MEKIKLLLDTDIGSDIDDAVCLAYLLMQPRCDLLGVTTVSGEANLRARMCSAIMKAAGREAPIFPGAEAPLLTPARQPLCQQAERLGDWPHDTGFQQNAALDFLRDAILDNPGEVTLLAIGPMTNVGLLFAAYPETAKALRSLVLMCGRFGNGIARMPLCEWNALNDPYATAIVYNAPVREHRSVGLDVTMQVTMGVQEVERRFAHPVLQPVKDFSRTWFKERRIMTFHDPLAAVAVFEPEALTWERGTCEVLNAQERTMGLTHWKPAQDGSHEIAVGVDAGAFFEKYFSVFA